MNTQPTAVMEPAGCMNGHAVEDMIIQHDKRICVACRDSYQRRNRINGYGATSIPTPAATRQRRQRKANDYEQQHH